jgi:LmbE family N-acetylglucosaminyl deacetylase
VLSAPGNPVRRRQLGLRNRFVEHNVETRHMVAGVMRAHQAQVVFAPYPEDAHPDHRAVTRIAEDARFDAKLTSLPMPGDEGRPPIYPKWLFHYYATHLRIVPRPGFVVDITGFLDRKIESVMAYRSQFVVNEANRSVVEWVRAQGVYFGSRIGRGAGEPFFAAEPVGLLGLEGLAL